MLTILYSANSISVAFSCINRVCGERTQSPALKRTHIVRRYLIEESRRVLPTSVDRVKDQDVNSRVRSMDADAIISASPTEFEVGHAS